MTISATEVWTRLLDQARQQVSQQTYRTWLEPTEALDYDGQVLYVSAPDQFAADWNDTKHADLLSSLAPVALGHPLRVVFRVNEERKARPQMDFFVAPPVPVARPARPADSAAMPLSARYTFQNFVIGKSNELAAAAAQAVAQAPGRIYNPLFLYGETGVGKTHLMQAVAHAVLALNPAARITYVGTEQFTNELISAITTRTTGDFRRRYRETDLLLVDDVHFLRGKESTQEEFFHTFNTVYEAGRQVILTSDRPPSEMTGVEARLVSRFQWGMVADMKLPDLEHRIAILRKKAEVDHLEFTIPDEVISFIAENVRSSVRELEGSIIKLLAYASLKHREITLQLAREALRDKLRPSGPGDPPEEAALSMTSIQQAVARDWGVTTEGLRSKTRTKTLTVPRQVAMYLARQLLGTQLIEIGQSFGGRDHSTVIHSLERVEAEVEKNPAFRARVDQLATRLRALADA